jgi:hypothetical protein
MPTDEYIPPVWKHHLNTEYIRFDFSTLYSDELIVRLAAEALEMILKRPDKSVRALINTKGSKTSPKAMRSITELGKKVQPKIKKSAIVGSTGLLSVLLKIYTTYTGSKIKFFTDEKLAIEYIIQD